MLTLRYNEPVFILTLRGRVGCLRQPTLPLSIDYTNRENKYNHILCFDEGVIFSCKLRLDKKLGQKPVGRGAATAPLSLNLGNRLRRAVSFTPQPFYPRGKPRQYPSDTTLWLYRSFEEEKKISCY